MKKMKRLYFLVVFFTSIIFVHTLSNCDGTTKSKTSYDYDIQPIFITRCTSCHFGEPGSGSRNIDLRSYSNLPIDTTGSSYGVIIPYSADNSLLYMKISSEFPGQGDRMPFGEDQLESSYIRVIEDWINEGARDN